MRWANVLAADVKFSQDLTHQKSLKSVNLWQSYLKNIKMDVFLGHSVYPWCNGHTKFSDDDDNDKDVIIILIYWQLTNRNYKHWNGMVRLILVWYWHKTKKNISRWWRWWWWCMVQMHYLMMLKEIHTIVIYYSDMISLHASSWAAPNSLPHDIRVADSFGRLRQPLRTHLYSLVFH